MSGRPLSGRGRLRETQARQGEASIDVPIKGLHLCATLSGLIRNTVYAGTVLGYAAYTFALGGLAFFMPTYFERVRGLELSRANFIVGSVTVFAGLSGTFLGGYLGDRTAARIKHGQLWLSGASSIAAVIPAWSRQMANTSTINMSLVLRAQYGRCPPEVAPHPS